METYKRMVFSPVLSYSREYLSFHVQSGEHHLVRLSRVFHSCVERFLIFAVQETNSICRTTLEPTPVSEFDRANL